MRMTISDYFERLGAPLANKRWSWGSIRTTDQAVFLRVWQDRKFIEGGHAYYMATHHVKYANNPDDLGHQERLKHVELIRSGANCYMIMCVVVDPEVLPRAIKSFNDRDIFIGANLVERDGETWIRAAGRVSADSLIIAEH